MRAPRHHSHTHLLTLMLTGTSLHTLVHAHSDTLALSHLHAHAHTNTLTRAHSQHVTLTHAAQMHTNTHVLKHTRSHPHAYKRVDVCTRLAMPAFDCGGRKSEMPAEVRVRSTQHLLPAEQPSSGSTGLWKPMCLILCFSCCLSCPLASPKTRFQCQFPPPPWPDRFRPLLPISAFLFTSVSAIWRPQDAGISQQAGTSP